MRLPTNNEHRHDDGTAAVVALLWVFGCVLFVLVGIGVFDGVITEALEGLLCDGTRFVCAVEEVAP